VPGFCGPARFVTLCFAQLFFNSKFKHFGLKISSRKHAHTFGDRIGRNRTFGDDCCNGFWDTFYFSSGVYIVQPQSVSDDEGPDATAVCEGTVMLFLGCHRFWPAFPILSVAESE